MTMAARNMSVINTSVTIAEEPIGVRAGAREPLRPGWAVAGWHATATVPNRPMAPQDTRAAEALAKEAISATSVGPTMKVTSCKVASTAYKLAWMSAVTRVRQSERTAGATGGTLPPVMAAIANNGPSCRTGTRASATSPDVLTAAATRSTGRRPTRSARRPRRGPIRPVAIT